jgi:hypothetical protein
MNLTFRRRSLPAAFVGNGLRAVPGATPSIDLRHAGTPQRALPTGPRRSVVAFLILSALPAGRCYASIIITAPTINLPYSATARTGNFEVYVQSTSTPQPQIGAMNVELQSPVGSALTFLLPTDSTPTVHPYLFSPQSPAAALADSGHTIKGTDFAFPPLPNLADGIGLLLVEYQVAAGASGNIPLTFASPTSNPVGTALFDANNSLLAATFANGSINIASPIPEPATWVLALLAAAALIGRLRRSGFQPYSRLQ